MGNELSAFNEKAWLNITTPSDLDKATLAALKQSEYPPSEELIKLWENVAETEELVTDCSITLNKPSPPEHFDQNSESMEFRLGKEQVHNERAYLVMNIFDCTDGNTWVYELVTGDKKGQLFTICHADDAVEITGRTLKDLLEYLKNKDYSDIEPEDIELDISDYLMALSNPQDE